MRYHDSETHSDIEGLPSIDEGPLDLIAYCHNRTAGRVAGAPTNRVGTEGHQGPALQDAGKSVCAIRTGIGVPRLLRPQLGRLRGMSGRSGMAAGRELW